MDKFSVGHLADCGGRAIEVYRASDVDALMDRIQIEARQQSPFTMSNINRLIIRVKSGLSDQPGERP
jgi:hypothetical protein